MNKMTINTGEIKMNNTRLGSATWNPGDRQYPKVPHLGDLGGEYPAKLESGNKESCGDVEG
jgi:hypothetical protein